MRFESKEPPRVFETGFDEEKIRISDCGSLFLEPDEQITLLTPGGKEYDVCRKSWGFYATPSTNGRLQRFGFRTALVRNRLGQFFVFLAEVDRSADFEAYLASERIDLVGWLDDEAFLARLTKLAEEGP